MRSKFTIVVILTLVIASGLAGLGVFLHHGYEKAVRWKAEEVLEKLSDKTGFPVDAEVDLPYPGLVRFNEMTIGGPQHTLVSIERIEVGFSIRDVLLGFTEPDAISISNVVVYGSSDGTLQGLYDWLKVLVPARKPTKKTKAPARRMDLPDFDILGFQFIDSDESYTVDFDYIAVRNQEINAFFRYNDIKCKTSGSFSAADVVCESLLSLPITEDMKVGFSTFHFTVAGGKREAGFTDLKVERPNSRWGEMLKDYSVDAQVFLKGGKQARHAFQYKVYANDGGEASGKGVYHESVLSLDVHAKDFPIDMPDYDLTVSIDGNHDIELDTNKKVLDLKMNGTVKELSFYHPKVSLEKIGPMDIFFGGRLRVEAKDLKNRIFQIDWENGLVGLDDVMAKINFHAQNTPGSRAWDLSLKVDESDASLVAAAIPPGLMGNVLPLKVEGPFQLAIETSFTEPDFEGLVFDIDLSLDAINIVSMNEKIDFNKLSGGFYTSFTGPKRYTGPKSTRWVSLSDMPAILPYVVMSSEDSSFLKHGGVRPRVMRRSLIANLEEDGFARGGSTVTMQLSRNLFLSPRKTLNRKLEEMFISWQMERYFQNRYKKRYLAKMKMMEVYLNIVEFGPGVYGIKNGARHFFQKTPRELNLYEMIWLIKRLPRPRFFSKPKEVRVPMARYINKLIAKMKHKKFLAEDFEAPISPGPWPEGEGPWSDPKPALNQVKVNP